MSTMPHGLDTVVPGTMRPGDRPSLGDLDRRRPRSRLAETQAIHAMAVEVDRALSEGRTSEHEWHNHNDLAEIERLRGELASHTTVAIADQDVRESMRRVLSTLNEARRIVEMPPVDDLNHRTPDSDP